ncbi:MAG: hypothetical protein GXP62_09915 [Oligoflexia bacterium]|nr:hypothetical protein [Oligoflexia bacterium]
MGVPHPYYHAGFLALIQLSYTVMLSVPTGIVLTAWFLFREPTPQRVSAAPG